ncbi:MAG: toprim domain-containing protein [Ktedonobacteraceae bacterium]|nr:toprim domain-containing protein [Ktedonobacteraceae bacterium]
MRIQTTEGKQIDVLMEGDLGNYTISGDRIRAYCPVHGSDSQKSLSITHSTGWGRCFNAACNATVLIREFNPDLARRLLQRYTSITIVSEEPHAEEPEEFEPAPRKPSVARPAASWQQEECAGLLRQNDLLCQALFDYRLADCWQAQAYLEARSIPLEIADQERIAYFPLELFSNHFADQPALARWQERLLFPLTSPTGRGFAGRALWRWQLHIDEATHKAMLDQPGAPPRWLKTNPAGWFCAPPVSFGDRVILVEGPFDRLALLAAGFTSNEVVALVGTTLHPDWLPEHVRHIVLAPDGDDAGIASILRLVEVISQDDDSREIYLCPPPSDQRGKDWSERWNRYGADGLAELLSTFDLLP